MNKLSRILLDLLFIFVVGIFVLFFSLFVLMQPLVVTGNSMLPNFHDSEQILVEKVSLKYREIGRGDVVIVKHPENHSTLLLKRVIGLPGETFEISNGNVFINGESLDEPYLFEQNVTLGKVSIPDNVALLIPSNSYVVLGDNRDDSLDSRNWGPLEKNLIVGRNLLVYAPIANFRLVR